MGFRDEFINKSPIKQTASGSSGSGNKNQELSYFDQFKANIAKNIDPYHYTSEDKRVEEVMRDGRKESLSEDPTPGYKMEYALYKSSPELYKKYWEMGEKAADAKDVFGRVISAGLGKSERENIYNAVSSVGMETGEVEYSERDQDAVHERKDLMSILMGTPQQFNSIEKSQYQPSNSKDPNATYYRSKVTEDNLRKQYDRFINHFNKRGVDKITTYNAGLEDNQAGNENVLGRYTVSKGVDEDGREYLSYYDKWDLQPFKTSSNLLTSVTDKLQDLAGIEAPEVYGRIYKDEIGEETWQDKMENRNNRD